MSISSSTLPDFMPADIANDDAAASYSQFLDAGISAVNDGAFNPVSPAEDEHYRRELVKTGSTTLQFIMAAGR